MVSILAPSAAKNAALGAGEGGGERDSSEDTYDAGGAPGGDAAAADAASADALLAEAAPPGLGVLLRQAGALVSAAAAALSTLPNSCFAVAPPPPHPGYSLPQRAGAALWTAVLYGALGLVCGGAGQARSTGREKMTHLSL